MIFFFQSNGENSIASENKSEVLLWRYLLVGVSDHVASEAVLFYNRNGHFYLGRY